RAEQVARDVVHVPREPAARRHVPRPEDARVLGARPRQGVRRHPHHLPSWAMYAPVRGRAVAGPRGPASPRRGPDDVPPAVEHDVGALARGVTRVVLALVAHPGEPVRALVLAVALEPAAQPYVV